MGIEADRAAASVVDTAILIVAGEEILEYRDTPKRGLLA